MTARIAQLTIDVRDLEAQAEFWSEALGMTLKVYDDGTAKLHPKSDTGGPIFWLQPVTEEKREKLRLHLDLRPEPGEDLEAEVQRLLVLGATRAEVGQTGEEGFTVLADPEGNEFCVLHSDPR